MWGVDLHLGKFAETMEPDFVAQELVPTFQSLSADGELLELFELQHEAQAGAQNGVPRALSSRASL